MHSNTTPSPFSAYFGTVISFDDTLGSVVTDLSQFLKKIKEDIHTNDQIIMHLERALAVAHKERRELAKYHQAHSLLAPPVHFLPSEILCDIFQYFVDNVERNVLASSRNGPWLLVKVCRRWRQVAQNFGYLWSLIRIPPALENTDNRAKQSHVLTEALTRAASVTLEIYFEDPLPEPLFAALISHASRWVEVELRMGDPGLVLSSLAGLEHERLPSLVSLRLLSYHAHTVAWGILDLFTHIPRIKNLCLDAQATTHDYCPTFPWSQLSELTLMSYCRSGFTTLQACQNLEILRLSTECMPGIVASGVLVAFLPRLKHLELGIDFSYCLPYLRCPSLTSISYQYPFRSSSSKQTTKILQDFIARSQCCITQAEVLCSAPDDLDAKSLLTPLDNVVELTMTLSESANMELGDRMSTFISGPYLPNLERLSGVLWGRLTLDGVEKLRASIDSRREAGKLSSVEISWNNSWSAAEGADKPVVDALKELRRGV